MPTETFDLRAKLTVEGADKAASDLSKFKGKTEEAEKSIGLFGQAASTAAGIITAQLVKAVAAYGAEALKLAGSAQTIGAGFEILIEQGSMGVTTLQTLRDATKGMVADIDLMQAANKALVLGLPINEFNELYRVATILGPVMGRTVTDAVNDLAMGIGRQSKMILDNLGIIVDLDDTYTAYGKTLGKTTEQMTTAEKKTALFNEVMRKASEVTEQLEDTLSPAQEALLRWTATTDNAKVAVGEFIASFAIEPIEDFTTILTSLTGKTEEVGEAATKSGKNWLASALDFLNYGEATTDVISNIQNVVHLYAESVRKDEKDITDTLEREVRARKVLIDDHEIHLLEMEQVRERARQNALVAEKIALEESIKAEKERLEELEEIRKEEERIWNEAVEGLETHWNERFGITDYWYDNMLDTAKDYFDDLRQDEENDHSERLGEIGMFYDDMLAEQRGFLDDIRNNRRADMDSMELNFLLQKQALQQAFAEGRINRKKFEEDMSTLEKTYRDQRSRTSDSYRIQELQAERQFATDSEIIEQQRLDAIESENRSFLLIMAAIMSQEKGDFKELYKDLVTMADTFGIDMGQEWAQLASAWGISSEDIKDEMDSLDTYIQGSIYDINRNLKDLGPVGDPFVPPSTTPTPSPPTTPSPPPIVPAGAEAVYNGIPIYRVGTFDPARYGSDLTTYRRFSIEDVIKDLKNLGYAKGFEGWVNRPTPMIVGEKGPEYVSVTPQNKMGGRGAAGGGGEITINLPNVTKFPDNPVEARRLARMVLSELDDMMYAEGVPRI